jgi:hypothetical protein
LRELPISPAPDKHDSKCACGVLKCYTHARCASQAVCGWTHRPSACPSWNITVVMCDGDIIQRHALRWAAYPTRGCLLHGCATLVMPPAPAISYPFRCLPDHWKMLHKPTPGPTHTLAQAHPPLQQTVGRHGAYSSRPAAGRPSWRPAGCTGQPRSKMLLLH